MKYDIMIRFRPKCNNWKVLMELSDKQYTSKVVSTLDDMILTIIELIRTMSA